MMENEKMDNWQRANREGLISTLQRMMGKLGDILQQQKSGKSTPVEMAIDPVQLWSSLGGSTLNLDSPSPIWEQFDDNELQDDCSQLSRIIECTLKEAKDGALNCGEVLLPTDLTLKIARDVIRLAENEPCGLRGCALLLQYQDQQSTTESKQIGLVQYDPSTVATFELLLTLKKDLNTWTNLRHFLPFKGCLRKLGKGRTIIVSPAYTLVKRKLYRSSQQS